MLHIGLNKWHKTSSWFYSWSDCSQGKDYGTCGAIVGGEDDTAEAKMRIVGCGIHVVASPAKIGSKMAELMGVNA